MAKPIPDGYHSVTPYLVVEDVARQLDWLARAFGAVEAFRMAGPDGRIGHAETRIGDSVIMMGQAGPEHPPMPAMLHLYVGDVDAVFRQAVAAGGAAIREPADQFYGDRSGGVKDPLGNHWWIATRKEELSAAEIGRRYAALRQKPA
jgi:uncharacterized glyoxalase superfamily protein PhnB